MELSLGVGARKPYKPLALVLFTYSCGECTWLHHKSLIVCGLKLVLFDEYSSLFG